MVNQPTTAVDLIPTFVQEHWPDTIPVSAFLIVDAIRQDGGHGLQVIHDDTSSPWQLIGMLRAVLVDMEARWVNEAWMVDDDEDS